MIIRNVKVAGSDEIVTLDIPDSCISHCDYFDIACLSTSVCPGKINGKCVFSSGKLATFCYEQEWRRYVVVNGDMVSETLPSVRY